MACNVHAEEASKPIAKINDTVITEQTFSAMVEREKSNWDKLNINMPADHTYYEKLVLKRLVTNALLDAQAKKEGIVVSDQEASEELKKQLEQINSLAAEDPGKISFLNQIKSSGHAGIEDYAKDRKVLEAYRKQLARVKLRNHFYETLSKTADNEKPAKAWEDYKNNLINTGAYEIYIPVDIKGFTPVQPWERYHNHDFTQTFTTEVKSGTIVSDDDD
jgi:SurA N-terminal domain.